MGEAKRKRELANDPEFIKALTDLLNTEGKLIDAGFQGLRLAAYKDAGPQQVATMRECFFAGAQHLFTSIMSIMDPGEEPTDADLNRMSKIAAELDAFQAEFMKRIPTMGGGH